MGNRPPSTEIAAYAVAHVYCRRCKAQPGEPCIRQAEAWRTACRVRFADGAREYAPLWRDAHKPAQPPEPVLAGVTRATEPLPAEDEETCPF